eukprot:s34_g19.t2
MAGKDEASHGSCKRFSGDDEDPGKQLRKWKTWAQAKMMTIKDLKDEQKAPWLLTLLDGRAWDACEHLTLDEIAKEGGEKLIWAALHERFPEKEQHDMMGEILGEVFALAACDQESMKQWTARVKETFEKCKRRAAVDFPSEARGWIALHCIGLTEERKAIVKAKAQGSLQFDDITSALRSCFPLYKAVGKKKGATVFQVEPERAETISEEADGFFGDVEALLADHEIQFDDAAEGQDTFAEDETAEALAVSWKERRKEIAKYQQQRQFGAANKTRRSFRIEVEELKKRTRCRKCNQLGHWARECKSGTSTSSAGKSSDAAASANVNYVEAQDSDHETPSFVGVATAVFASGLVQSPGYGVVDSGCGRTLVGQNTLDLLKPMIEKCGYGAVVSYQSDNSFRFGNGAVEKSTLAVKIPVGVAGRFGLIDAAVITGSAPLLIGRPTLEKLAAKIDFGEGVLHFLDTKAKMITNEAGQVLIDILDFPEKKIRAKPTQDRPTICSRMHDHSSNRTPCEHDNPSPDKTSFDGNGNQTARTPKTKVTLKKKECRCLLAQFQKSQKQKSSKVLIAELFSPPRFSLEAQRLGAKGLSYDVKQGYDLEDPVIQAKVGKELEEAKPDLLVVCPPCRNRGGWEHLNRIYRTPLENARLIRSSRRQVKFCEQQIQKQLKRGGEFLFEHPWPSEVWEDSIMQPLKRKYGVRRIDMCAYDLKCPDTQLPIQKGTGIMSSCPAERNHLFLKCPGCPRHRTIEGKLKNGMNVSAFCAEYTKTFVSKMLETCLPTQIEKLAESRMSLDAEMECLVSEVQPAAESEHAPSSADATVKDPKILQAIKRLHCNLGHPHVKDMVRILRHSNASADAIKAAQSFECDVCKNHVQPSSSLPAKTSRVLEFNEKVGMDVKYLKGWKTNQMVPCISIIDYATSLHIMAPIFQRENAEITKGVLRDSWIAWAGVPKMLEMDPSSSNLSDLLGDYCESMGIDTSHIAADSHWQLGKVERHGHWFAKIFERVCDECQPTTSHEFVDCVLQTQTAKNALISEAGASPYQLVFGRNPRVPQDLLQDDTHVPASDAVLADAGYQRSQAIRQAARLAVLQCQDDKALRTALRARPRIQRQFVSGDWVYYWRSQKWQNGTLLRGADGMVVANFDQNELLGVKNLLEKGQFPRSQFVDLTNQDQPDAPEQVADAVRQDAVARSAAEIAQQSLPEEPKRESAPVEAKQSSDAVNVDRTNSEQDRWQKLRDMPKTETYGPFRHVRHTYKHAPEFLHRPPVMEQDDFAEMMEELVPALIEQQLQPNSDSPMPEANSPRGDSSKREASPLSEEDRPAVRARLEDVNSAEIQVLAAEFVQHANMRPVEALVAAFLQKRAQKEMRPCGHEPELQSRVDESKTVEWETLLGKNAIKIWKGRKAREILEKQQHRFIGSRFVVVNKHDEDGDRIKSRWCLQGHLDPDFKEKIGSGVCHSPTLHPLSRALILQILVSKGWLMQLGDIKGAFLEAGPINPKFAPLYAKQPEGGVPGLDPEDVIEVTGNVYGSNDAPFKWWHTFDGEVQTGGWCKSQFDNCLYYLFEPAKPGEKPQLCGVLGAHVDDTITGGQGATYEAAIAKLKARFPYRKWRQGSGEFCGVTYCQDPLTKEITYQQKEYAQHLRPISLSKERQRDKNASATEREVAALRAINGAANWLCGQSRPDLGVQTSFSQQCFPAPKVKDLLYANQLVHRAKQYSSVDITVKKIPWDRLCICFHSDAGFGNAKAYSTQAGYIAAFVDMKLSENQSSPWSPFAWKSYKLPRKVASTLAGEAQAYATAAAVSEWMALMVSEAKHGVFDLRSSQQWQDLSAPTVLVNGLKLRDQLEHVPIVGITDCKSLYDNLISMSSVSKAEDKRVAIDLAIVKQSMLRCKLCVRWCPTSLMLADGQTKDQQDPADLLRSALHVGEYQLNDEAMVLEQKKQFRTERDRRKELQMQKEKAEQNAKQAKKSSPAN